ncbi:hypothetical protein NDS46_30940 (plasmid) [Paenibacillus thiaminolyticus]|uniref:hypothetical protein n=1 Tax=Paenibacillus thiaminolyticus TaxID=49283 RepID=UPI00232C1DB7|nr:hypothetical protein [Paenibacillus thiaminolyticus]WCF11763.1 hypothetical protein NDS46_30940 [Paenibacillus thiaminolyticus]
MFHFNKQTFFLVPTSFTKDNMEFNIFNEHGDLIGTTIRGISKGFVTTLEKEKLESYLLDESLKLEAEIKFLKEFGLQVSEAGLLNISCEEIFDIMEEKWLIPMEVMDEVLGCYL